MLKFNSRKGAIICNVCRTIIKFVPPPPTVRIYESYPPPPSVPILEPTAQLCESCEKSILFTTPKDWKPEPVASAVCQILGNRLGVFDTDPPFVFEGATTRFPLAGEVFEVSTEFCLDTSNNWFLKFAVSEETHNLL